MKSFVVNKLVDNIKKHFNYTDTKLLELKYGIEVIYLTITKTIVIVLLALLLGVFKELLFILLFYSILRATGFGVHAQKAWHCWLSSIVIFLGVPILLSYAQALPTPILIILSSLFLLLIFIFAPADTEKRPIVSRKRRMIYKTMCSLTALTYSIIIVFTTNTFLANSLLASMAIEVFMILPTTYKLFNVKINNYKKRIICES